MSFSIGAIRMRISTFAMAAALLLPIKALASDEAVPDIDALNAAAPADTDTQASDAPSVEWPLKHLYCVEYARLRSGLAIFGDAKEWWGRARHLYSEFARPAAEAVMVFAGSSRIVHGHVAVVTEIVSPREIRVDHANWQNRGEIDRNMPVLDVSRANDWSRVRVWDVHSGQFGAHVYAIKGFIAGPAPSFANAGL
jgi:surface antigen